MSVREYAVLYLGSSTSGAASASGGNAILPTGTHDLEGPTHTLLPGALLVKREISPTALAADADDWAPTGIDAADVVRVDLSADVVVTGIDAPDVAYALLLENVSAFALTLSHDDAASAAGNRILCPGGADASVPADGAVLVAYDTTSAAWRVIAASGSGGSVAAKLDGTPVVAAAVAFDFRSGLYVSDLGSGVARVDVRGKVVLHSSCGAAEAIDHDAGTWHDLGLDATSCALTVISTTTLPTDREAGLTLVLRQDATGGRLADWSGIPVVWQDNVVPVLSTAPNAVDVISLVTPDGGTTYFGFYGVVPPIPTSIDDLTDVDTTTVPPGDGQALLWDAGLSEWIPGNVAASGSGEVGSVLVIAPTTADFVVTPDGSAFVVMP